jgi:hypothetical protein
LSWINIILLCLIIYIIYEWFSGLEKSGDSRDISRAWETFRENIKITAEECLGHYEWKWHKRWFDEECSKYLDQKKQTKLQGLQDSSQINAGSEQCKM